MNILEHGKHKILFSKGNLYLDGVKIAGDGINPPKDVVFEFHVDKPREELPKEPIDVEVIEKDPSLLEVNVADTMKMKSIGPGQA